MKKYFVVLLLLLVSSPAYALTLTQVGGYDVFKAAGNIVNTSEQEWIAEAYGYNSNEVTFTKWEAGTSDPQWANIDDNQNGIYLDFDDANTFAFLIKSASQNNPSIYFDDGAVYADPFDTTSSFYGGSEFYNSASSTQIGPFSTYLFSTTNQYGALDLAWFSKNPGNFTIETISHTSFSGGDDGGGGGGGGGHPVPEPATIILLGAGLVGLAAYRRKKH